MVSVSVDKLLETCIITPTTPWGYQITIEEVEKAIEDRVFESTPWELAGFFDHGLARFSEFTEEERQYHIRRIAYLAFHGWSDPIEIDVGCPCLGFYTDWLILDGNHRFFAAVVRKDKLILSTIAGELGYAEELLGIEKQIAI
jgi:hypothetical protein